MKNKDKIKEVINKSVATLKTMSCNDCSEKCDSPINCKCSDCDLIGATENAIFALERLKPKKPILLDDQLGYHDQILSCPECKNPITNVWSNKKYQPLFCHCCGQRFSWLEKE